jgi:hypothetical protein
MAIGKLLRGSGFSEILIKLTVCDGGSIEQVMNGKHKNKTFMSIG